jgi:hypothetical protein
MMPQCDDEPPPEDEFDKAADFGASHVGNLWGNPDDFFRAILLTQSKLGCTLSDEDLQPPPSAC